jgi:hypothetical protein
LSITVTTCVAVAVLPAPSVTVQTTVVVPSGNVAGALFTTLATVQLSAVTVFPKLGITAPQLALAETVNAAGAVIVGFVLSFTVTNWVTVVVLPLLSVTVHVTVVAPKAKTLGALLVTLAIVQLSVAVGKPSATLNAAQELFAVTTTFAGAVTTGACVSVTVTVCVAVVVLPALSVTVQTTVVVPSGNVAGALLVTLATPQLSAVVGVPKTTVVAKQLAFAEAETFDGAVIVGLVLSITVTTCVAVAVLPAPSVTVQTTVVVPSGNVAGALFTTLATVQLSAVIAFPKVEITA